MKKTKFYLIVIILIIVLLFTCACLPNRTKMITVWLSKHDHSESIEIGEFELVSVNGDNTSAIYEVPLKNKEKFVKFLQNSEYYIGTYALNENSYFLHNKSNSKHYSGGECMWFFSEGDLWLGKYYAKKFYYMTYISDVELELDDLSAYLPVIIFAGDEEPDTIGEEYECAITWEQLKFLYPNNKIDEVNYTIEIDCELWIWGIGRENYKTLLYYNAQNNTIKVSGDYYSEE